MTDISNITLTKNGTTVTVLTKSVKYNISKKLVLVTPAQSSANWTNGPKDTKIVDLLRIEKRYTVNGEIEYSDKANLKSIVEAGGVITMSWDGDSSISINIDKLDMDERLEDRENTEVPITFTAIVGVDL